MENKDVAIENILQLPNEVLHLIFQQIPETLVVGEVCKRFYAISCNLRAVRTNFTKCELDNEILDSVLNSGRKIEALDYSSYSNILKRLLKHIGENIKDVSIQGCTEKFSFKTIQLLNLMPNLTHLHVSDIRSKDKSELPKNFRLQLHQLKELKISGIEDVAKTFRTLPDDVLEKLSIFYCYNFNGIFNNQRNLKHVEADGRALECLDLQNAKLKTLYGPIYDSRNLKGQDELVLLEFFAACSQEDIILMCRELKSIENLMLIVNREFELSAIANLKNLKTLKFEYSGHYLETLKSNSLENLIYNGFHDSEIFSVNCPNLRHLEILQRRLDVSSIFLNFPKLEEFNCSANEITFNGEFGSERLKVLGVEVGCGKEDQAASADALVAIVMACPNLEMLSTNIRLGYDRLQDLLIGNPSLKSLCLEFMPNIQIIKNFGKHLENVHIMETPPPYAASLEFADQFDVFEEKWSGVVMKKRGFTGKCCRGFILFSDALRS